MKANRSEQASLMVWLGMSPFIIFCEGCLVVFAYLRETPGFWQNSGGYSVSLRHLVEGGFYPLLGLTLCALSIFSFKVLIGARGQPESRYVQLAGLAVLWLMVAVVAITAIANNINNMLDGRPLHAHF